MGIVELLAAACLGAAPVHFGSDVPSLRSNRVVAGLAYYVGPAAMDSRINQSATAALHAHRPSRIVWRIRRGGARLSVRAQRLDAPGVVVQQVAATGRGRYESSLRLPSAGCWWVSVVTGAVRGAFVIRAFDPPAEQFCEPSPVLRSVPHPRFGNITWLPATPRASQIAAVLFVSTLPDVERAVIYAGGRAPEGWSTKFLWSSPRTRGQLQLVGKRLDGDGRFAQWLQSASSSDPPVTGTIYPSIVSIPSAGCWGVTLRSPRAAGFVVFQAVVT